MPVVTRWGTATCYYKNAEGHCGGNSGKSNKALMFFPVNERDTNTLLSDMLQALLKL